MPQATAGILALLLLLPGSARGQQLSLSVNADAPGNDHQNLNGEWVSIRLQAGRTVDLSGWRLCDAANHCFTFPDGASIDAGDELRVYTGSGRRTATRFYMGSRRAVWNNNGDVATLTDRDGRVVARFRY